MYYVVENMGYANERVYKSYKSISAARKRVFTWGGHVVKVVDGKPVVVYGNYTRYILPSCLTNKDS